MIGGGRRETPPIMNQSRNLDIPSRAAARRIAFLSHPGASPHKFFLSILPSNRINNMNRLKKSLCLLLVSVFILVASPAKSGLIINEIATGTGSDWVELFFSSSVRDKIDISRLYVTMYYGTNESLGTEPITLYSYDRPETPYDDRFAVVHLTSPGIPDETDRTGDTNHNGYLDIYCNNYYGSLWNSEGVVAIDTDDNPASGGIIDFVAYSNRDGNPNSIIQSSVDNAISSGQWKNILESNIQAGLVDIGKTGLKPYMSIARKDFIDTNRPDDFAITSFQTPGKPNIFSSNSGGKRLFKCLRKRITIIPGRGRSDTTNIQLRVLDICNIKFRVFTSTGILIHESQLYRSVPPGDFSIQWRPFMSRASSHTSMYIGHIEAVSTGRRISQAEKIFIILSRYK